MKKLILGFILLFAAFQMSAQEDTGSTTTSANTWQARLRVIAVIPDESATIETIGGDVDLSTSVVPELDFTYFFTENWAAELILGTTKHDVKAVKTAVGEIDLGHVWLLPPTLTAQYHFTGGDFKPYIGAGINYTFFYGVDEGPIADNVEYDNSFGFAFQAGADYALSDTWFVNIDIKKLLLQSDVTVDASTALEAVVGADVDINPLIFGAGVGMKF